MYWWEQEWGTRYSPDADENGAHRFLHKHLEVRIVVGITCSLSVIGSLLIILSYVCFRDMRSRARLILVNISIMDLGVGLSNLIGASVYFDRFYESTDCLGDTDVQIHPRHFLYCPPAPYLQGLCVAQAFFASYFTLGSIMWTISLSLFLYFLIVHHGTKKAKLSLIFLTFFSYGMPLLITLWLLKTERLGFAPFDSGGWCGNIYNHPETGYRDIFAVVFSYDIWIYLTIVLVPILSLSVHLFIRDELKKSHPFFNSERYHQALQSVDYKFLLIPVAFVLLRIWTCIMGIVFIYIGVMFREVPNWAGIILINLSGIGDSAQGVANVILFVLFTKRVREKVKPWLKCGRLRRPNQVLGEKQRLLNSSPRAVRGEDHRGISQSHNVTPPPLDNSGYNS